jgi:glycerol-3-phosphate dehydrogenase
MQPPDPLPSREDRLATLSAGEVDVAVVGGGVTGAGIALDLTLRGARTALLERGDWASATSSASSRLVHGGLRYLEQFEIGLVRESCLERALLLRNAAGLVWPERFVYPVRSTDRVGRAKLAAGLWLYTALSVPRALGLPRVVGRGRVRGLVPGIDERGLTGGGTYLDAATDDARLTLAVVLTAIRAGAAALSRTEAVSVEPEGDRARVRWRDLHGGASGELVARRVVLAGGPFTEDLRTRAGLEGRWVAPTRGSHVVLDRRRLPTDGCVIFSSPVDGRVMFLLTAPARTVIGTTDLDADPARPVRATREEVRYLLDSANGIVPGARLGEDDVISTWAGLRPLLAAPEGDPSARSREERVEREGPVVTIAGGKLTGYRAMAEKLAAPLAQELGLASAGRRSPTRTARLWGSLSRPVPTPDWSSPGHGGDLMEYALTRRYGAWRGAVRELCRKRPGAGRELDEETLLGEVDWAMEQEDALTPADWFLRRTDLGYARREVAEAAIEPVLDRMARHAGWEDGAWERHEAELRAELDLRHAWRDDAP